MNLKVFIHSDSRGNRNGVYEFPSREKCYKWLNTNLFGNKVSARLRLQLVKDGCVEDASKTIVGYWYELKHDKPTSKEGKLVFPMATTE
jgi:hypothetical protein